MAFTDILNVTEVEASQSQKEVTINEALNALANAGNASVVVLVGAVASLQIPFVGPAFIFDRNLVFDLTPDASPPAGAFTVELPATKRLFVIRNLTAQAATIEVDPTSDGADGTTVTIPAGERRVLYSTGVDVIELANPSSGGSTFTGLTDTPSAYTGEALKAVRVNAGETALEFYTPAGASKTLTVAVSDETTDITTGTAKITFRAPQAMTISAVRASLSTAASVGTVTVDINEAGVSILSTLLTIDATEKTSTTAATPAVISDAAIADDAEITIDIDVAGTGAKGLKVTLVYS